ncbi:MAG: hypothetical protein MMC23_003383 [Stictis urceolatum]|nr:hypothetical protein [Stictis urceolata]
MPVRRHHEKSRHGCIQCKARKVKCDEAKPVCGGCNKRGAKCSFQDATSSFVFVSEFNGAQSKGSSIASPPNSANPDIRPSITSPPASASASGSIAGLELPPPPPPPPPPLQQHHLPLAHNPQSLPSLDHTRHSSVSSAPSQPSRSNALSPSIASAPSEGIFTAAERDNLRLMRYYMLFVYKQINGDPKQFALWRDYIPELAFQHDYLLHMVLAMSALHMAITNPPSTSPPHSTPMSPESSLHTPPSASAGPSSPHSSTSNPSTSLSASPTALALHHHTLGLSLFRPNVSNVTPSTIQPLFAFSCLLAIFAFGAPRASQHPPDILPEIIHSISLLRGTGTIVRQGTELLKTSPMAALMLPFPHDPHGPLPPRLEAALAHLAAKNVSAHVGSPEIRDAYTQALAVLRNAFLLADERPGSGMVVVPFSIFLPDRVALGLRAGEPMALVLLAYYAVLLHQLQNSVWLKGLGRRVVGAVWDEVGEGWRECLGWAVGEVQGESGTGRNGLGGN